ncbi:PspA-associated protein PspAB [Actinocorallia libanotica]|uniref:Uncharacterized protein n=1 Tax=Actinocorallia libanotica TaxID=46162 RepID=A0ABP4BA56_9ACTN
MGFLDTLLGRAKADLDRLYALPEAAAIVRSATGYAPTGVGSVCFATPEDADPGRLCRELQDMLDATPDAPTMTLTEDVRGYTWLLAHHAPDDFPELVDNLHAMSAVLQNGGFATRLLCTMVAFRNPAARPLALVYLYKCGTFYPFAPLPNERRNNHLEFQVRAELADTLPIETDLTRWFPLWSAPDL